MKFRKKPVVIEARQITPENAEQIGGWCDARKCVSDKYKSYLWGWGLPIEQRHLRIDTLEGEHVAGIGDWVIQGVKGEFYPCKPDIFEMTYEPADEPTGFVDSKINPIKREWIGLTGAEVEEAYLSVSDKEWAIGGMTDARVFFCAIEAKLREKNGDQNHDLS